MSTTTSPIIPSFNNWLSKKSHFRSKTIQIGERPKTRSGIKDLKVDTSIAQDLSQLSIPQPKTSHPLLSPILNDGQLSRSYSSSSDLSDTTPYLAPCERKVCSTQDDYLINEKLPKLDTLMSKVEFGIRRSDFTPLAFKTIRDDKVAKKELRNLKMVKDLPHVIQILDYFYDDNGHTVLVLPVLKKFEFHKLDFLQLAKYSQQLIKAIDGVHSKGLIHMDVTCSNLMLDSDGNLVLIDLGLARKANRPCSSTLCPPEEPECSCGTPGFISPEVYHNETPTYKSDIYSVGIVLGCFFEHYLVGCDLHYLGGSLVRSSTTEVIIQKLVSFLSHRPTSGSCGSSVASSCYYVNDTPDVIYDAADLLQSMIQTLPENRPSSSEILLHPFFLTLDRLSSSPLPPTLDPFANTDWETYENKKRILTYREMQWQQSMDSDEDCYYSYL